MRVADLFLAPRRRWRRPPGRLVTQLARLFDADTCVLLLRDGSAARCAQFLPCRPNISARVSRQLVAAVAADGHALLSGDRITTPPGLSGAFEATDAPSVEPADLSTMCAPIAADGETSACSSSKSSSGPSTPCAISDCCRQLRGWRPAGPASRLAELVQSVTVDGGRVVASHSARVQEVFRNAQRVGATDVTVVITGESGTGKEILARRFMSPDRGPRGRFRAQLQCHPPAPCLRSETLRLRARRVHRGRAGQQRARSSRRTGDTCSWTKSVILTCRSSRNSCDFSRRRCSTVSGQPSARCRRARDCGNEPGS